MELTGRTIREWTLHEPIGQGAMGLIHRATHKFNEGEYAIKCLKPERSAIAEIRERFLREARMAASLRHANIVETFPAFEEDGALYLPMELLRGNALQRLIEVHQGPWPFDAIRCWIGQAARGLAHAHASGVFHRDVKPGNLFVLVDGRSVKVLDFGLARSLHTARMTRTGMTVGTPLYLAPEVIDGEDATGLSDLYALGMVTYRRQTRQMPFTIGPQKTTFALAHAIRRKQAAGFPSPRALRPEIPAELEALVMSLLSEDPKGRPPDAAAVAEALRGELAVPPATALMVHTSSTSIPLPAPEPSEPSTAPLPIQTERPAGDPFAGILKSDGAGPVSDRSLPSDPPAIAESAVMPVGARVDWRLAIAIAIGVALAAFAAMWFGLR